MKCMSIGLSAVILLLAGCEYEAPLVKNHDQAVDTSILGLWEPVPDEGASSDPDEQMMILKYSDTEYLIHYPTGKNGIYYRGYPFEIGGVKCVQLQVLGTAEGPPDQDEKKLFHVASYQLADGRMEVRTLNTAVVDDDLKTTEELAQAFLEQKKNQALFSDPALFRRVRASR